MTDRAAPGSGEGAEPHVRVLLHDYGGYAFIVQLARELARRGHDVHHVHYASLRSGKGPLTRRDDDPPSLTFSAIDVNGDFDRYAVGDRLRLERRYARALANVTSAWRPEVVMCSNTPLFLLRWLRPYLARAGVPLVNWLQDLHSLAMGQVAVERLGAVAGPGAALLEHLESRLLRSCARVVAVSPDFEPVLERWGVPDDRVAVVPNWAELLPRPERRNPFSTGHGLDGRTTLLYAGTLGLKHEPRQLVVLAEAFRGGPDVAVVVVSEGLGRQWLESECAARGLDNVVLLDFQPYETVADMLGSGDVLLSMIRAGAGRFSVPSKILSYLVAGRAQLAALPRENLSARVLSDSGGGVVVEPDAVDDWTSAARRLVDDPRWRNQLGDNGRAYAEANFDIASRAELFEGVLCEAVLSNGLGGQ